MQTPSMASKTDFTYKTNVNYVCILKKSSMMTTLMAKFSLTHEKAKCETINWAMDVFAW